MLFNVMNNIIHKKGILPIMLQKSHIKLFWLIWKDKPQNL
jgi:hypothetical protein